MVARLAEQKGIDLLIPVLDRLLADDVRLVVLGEGDSSTSASCSSPADGIRNVSPIAKAMDEPLSHLIYAGADISLVPRTSSRAA